MNPFPPRHPDDTADFGRPGHDEQAGYDQQAGYPEAGYDPASGPTLIDPEMIDPDAADAALADAHAVDLADDPFADDLAERLDAVAPRRWLNRTTVALAGLVLLVGGFVAGAQVQKHWGTQTSASANRGTFGNGTNPFAGGNFPGLTGRGGTGGTGNGGTGNGGTGTGTGGGATTGTVKLVDGTTVYITTSDGQTVIVKTGPSTTVNLNQAGTLKDLAPGATVSIQGQTGSDGSLSATSITKTK
jgi:hypothetical protein